MAREFTDVELDAYLDGELTDVARSEVEARLREDRVLANRLDQMRGAWSLLEHLEHASTTDDFTKTTMKVAAVQAGHRNLSRWIGRRRKGIVRTIVGFAAGFGLMFVPSYLQDQRRLRDLPIIDNIDMYTQAGGVEFLRELDRAGLFSQDEELLEGTDDVF